MKATLEEIKADPEIKKIWENKSVRIWSNEYYMYWRPGCAGYTPDGLEAGVWAFEDAFRITNHCDPSKQIMFKTV